MAGKRRIRRGGRAGAALRRTLSLCAVLLATLAPLGCDEDTTSVSDERYSSRSDSSFAVGDSSVLEVGNFAGKIVVVPGDAGAVRVVATKWAARAEDLGGIELEMTELANGVQIEARTPPNLRNVSVDLEITVPADARPTLSCAAGNIGYRGDAEGHSLFQVGAGSITLRLPPDVNVAVVLSVGAGTIVVGFPVDGDVTDHSVDGVIGTGADGRIVAQTGAGNISVLSQ